MKDSTAVREFNVLAHKSMRSGSIEATPELVAWIERNPQSMSIPWISSLASSMGSNDLAELARRSRTDPDNFDLSGRADKRAKAPLPSTGAPASEFSTLARAAFSNSRIQLNEALGAWMRDNAPFLADPWIRSCIEKLGSPELTRHSERILSELRSSRFAQALATPSPDIASALESGTMSERAAARRELDQKIFLATIRSSPIAIDAALAAGADIDAKNNAGSTALHLAIERFDPPTVSALIARGARKSSVDSSGLTPLGLAEKLKAIRQSNTDSTAGDNDEQDSESAETLLALEAIVALLSPSTTS